MTDAPATPGQVKLLLSVAATRDIYPEIPTTRGERLAAMREILSRGITAAQAGRLIDALQHKPFKPRWHEQTPQFEQEHAAFVRASAIGEDRP